VKLTYVDARNFTERLRLLVDDEAYRLFQNELQDNPEKGDLIPGGGGVRKVPLRLPGWGKSGGARAIYLYLKNHAVIYFLILYTKKEQAGLSRDQRKAIRGIVEEIKRAWRDRLSLR